RPVSSWKCETTVGASMARAVAAVASPTCATVPHASAASSRSRPARPEPSCASGCPSRVLLVQLDQAELEGLVHRLTPRVDLELAVDAPHVGGDGVRGDPHEACRLRVAEPLDDQRQDLVLSLREARQVPGLAGPPDAGGRGPEALQEVARDRCADR